MRFFLPGANDSVQAEERFQAIRSRLSGELGELEPRRVYSIRFQQDGHSRVAAVGGQLAERDGRPILAIFERPDAFYVCTGILDRVDGPPVRIARELVAGAQEFTALA